MYPELFEHMEWADAAVWTAVLSSEAAMHDETLRSTLVHIHSAQQAFLDVWRGKPFRFRDASEFAGIGELYALARPYYGAAREFAGGLDQAAIDGRQILPWLAPYEKQLGQTFAPTTLGETIYQVIAHGNHHRGQVNIRLRALGVTPPTVDYLVWVFFGKPGPAWPAAVSL
jgi:uncharacterized damage-inducible protein DinB